MNIVSINGMSITSSGNIVVSGGKVFVDGKDVTPDSKEINITVEGTVGRLEVDVCSKIVVSGDAGFIKTQSGDVSCGNVEGSVHTMSGDVRCLNVGGGVSTMSGDITHKSDKS